MDAKTLVDYAASLDCIHCGLCLHACPTYRATGHEASSPRGRIHMMRGVAEQRMEPDRAYAEELDFCLVCRSCESVCPAGVRFGEMMEFARDRMEAQRRFAPLRQLARWLGFSVLLPHRGGLRLAASLLRLAQRLGLTRLAPLLGRRAASVATLPCVPGRAARRPLPRAIPAVGTERTRVALLEGCVQAELFGEVNRATARALAARGVSCRVPEGLVCCGALHAHNGDLAGARALARRAIEAFERVATEGAREIVVNAAGCGAHLKAYGTLLRDDTAHADRARSLALRVRDLSETLAAHAPPAGSVRLPPDLLALPVAWDDPCHLCHGQGVRAEPRALLDAVGGLARVELDDAEQCCGSAGVYSLLRPDDAARVFEPKLRALERSGARTVVTSNPGCQLQWLSGLARAGRGDVAVLHLAQVLAPCYEDASTSGSAPKASISSSARSSEAGALSDQRTKSTQ